jgi:hypothetical protein
MMCKYVWYVYVYDVICIYDIYIYLLCTSINIYLYIYLHPRPGCFFSPKLLRLKFLPGQEFQLAGVFLPESVLVTFG